MNTSNRHPDSELLDRLRSGLLDEQPEQRTQLEAHLAGCADCRTRADWARRLQLDAAAGDDLQRRLDLARERALHMPRAWSLRRLALPVGAAAAVAMLAVVLVKPVQSPEPQLADSSAVEVPELYEELDFYLWLADHKGSSTDPAT
jgi:hypothetical protein